jgi:hypothetical protein
MGNFQQIVAKFIDLGNLTIIFLGLLALLVFALGIGRFIRSTESGQMEKTKNLVIWGVAGIFVLVSIWGIVAVVRNEFGWGRDSLTLPLLKE